MKPAPVNAVELRGISKAFGAGSSRVVANADVTLVARRGSIHAIVGENGDGKSTAMKILFGASGAGKSTILKLILGLLRPDAGRVLVDGARVDTMTEDELLGVRANIGMLFQEKIGRAHV